MSEAPVSCVMSEAPVSCVMSEAEVSVCVMSEAEVSVCHVGGSSLCHIMEGFEPLHGRYGQQNVSETGDV